MGKGKYDEIDNSSDPRDFFRFTIGIIAAQVVGLFMVILVGIWMSKYHDGYGWDTAVVFNYHPLFMTLGLIFLYGDGKPCAFAVLRSVGWLTDSFAAPLVKPSCCTASCET